MKKLFKKSLAICLMAALVLSAIMGAMVVSAEGVVATKGALTGSIEFLFNTKINFKPVEGATAYGAEVYRTDKGEAKAVDVPFDSINKAVVGISNISLNNITKTFTFKPYAIVDDAKVYAEAFTSSYAEWLVSKKDGTRLNAEINNLLDTYAAIAGEVVYKGQEVDLEAAPEMGEGKWVVANAVTPMSVEGDSEMTVKAAEPVQGSIVNGKLRVNLDYGTKTGTFGVLVYKSGNAYDLADVSNANANIVFEEGAMLSVDISGIAVANYAKQYTFIPYVVNGEDVEYGNVIKVSYADFIAYALNKGNADQKAQAYAIVKAYKAAYGVDLVVFEEPKNLVVNPSFAERNKGWSKAGSGGAYAAGTVDALKQFVKEGDEGNVFSFNARNDKLWQYVKVEKNTTYTFSFDYFRFADAGWFQARIGLANQVSTSLTDGKIVCDNKVKGEKTWETFTTTVNSGDYEYICIYLVQAASASTNWNDYVNGKNIWVDNVRLVEAQ